MKRKQALYGNGAGAITADLPPKGDAGLTCQRCQDKEDYIVRLQAQIERLQTVVRDQQEEIAKKQRFFERVKMALADQGKTLSPVATTRPARRGDL